MRILSPSVVAILAFGTAHAQGVPDAPLPPAPQPVTSPGLSRPLFALPPADLKPPTDPPAAKPASFCMGSTEGAFSRVTQAVPLDLRGEMKNYANAIYSDIFTGWAQHMTRSEKDLWARGRMTVVRFLIHPDGTYDTPEITVSSGKTIYDKRALDAIYANPSFPPPPGERKYPVAMCLYIGFNLEVAPDKMTQGWLDSAEKREAAKP